MNKTISYIYVILSAVCWGFIGFSNRLLTEAGMTLGNRVFVRNFGTLLVLTVVFGLFHRQVFRIRLKHLPIFLGSGLISILLLSVVYFQCQTMCSLSVAAVLLYLAPSFVVLASAVLWKTPLTMGKVAALCVSLLGCIMVSGVLGGDMTASWAGIGLGVVSGMCYASYTVFSHYGLARYESYTMIYWTFPAAQGHHRRHRRGHCGHGAALHLLHQGTGGRGERTRLHHHQHRAGGGDAGGHHRVP